MKIKCGTIVTVTRKKQKHKTLLERVRNSLKRFHLAETHLLCCTMQRKCVSAGGVGTLRDENLRGDGCLCRQRPIRMALAASAGIPVSE